MALIRTSNGLGVLFAVAAGLSCLVVEAQQPQRPGSRRSAPAVTTTPAPTPRGVRREPRANQTVAEVPDAQLSIPEGVEQIQERDPNGNVVVERYVIQDAAGNYVNHGPWTQFSAGGKRVGTGEYQLGKRQGRWVRGFNRGEAEIINTQLHQQFQAPYISEVTVVDDQLHGTWTVHDARGLKISEWEFENGKRDGKSIWYYPNGQRAREIDYRDGEIDGKVLAWDVNEKLVQDDTYFQGRKHASRTLKHQNGRKKAEGWVLFAKEAPETSYDWLAGRIVATRIDGSGTDEKHGMWSWWYPNGQKYSEGRYLEDQPVGTWIFWHSNGQKQMEGDYVSGILHGKWTWWREDGTVARVEVYGDRNPLSADDQDLPTETSEVEQDETPEIGRLRLPTLE